MPADFETRFEKYAELAVKTWLNVQPGQRLLIQSPLEGAPLARAIAKRAYQNGSPFVHFLWMDSEAMRIRFQYAPRDSWQEFPDEWVASANAMVERGDALLAIMAQDPDLLRGLDVDFIAKAQKNSAEKMRALSDAVRRNATNWLGIGMPMPAWAQRVFPGVSAELAVEKLWDAIFKVCRVDAPDPIAAWNAHIADLSARRAVLNAKQYAALHYFGGETDLTVGLPDEHVWVGVTDTSQRGVVFIPNAPTDEIFTAPHRERVNGIVTSTKPLPVHGVVIEKFSVRFEAGRAVEIRAPQNQDILEQLIATDENAAYLGEIALVPQSSPVAKSGLLFYNALFDENAACHLALGAAYPQNIRDGTNMSEQELTARGVNSSLIHLDFMIGSNLLNIDGIRADGAREPILRAGEWAFEA